MADTIKEMSVKLTADVAGLDSGLEKAKTKWLDWINTLQQGYEKVNGGTKRTVGEINKTLDDIADKTKESGDKQIKALAVQVEAMADTYKKGSADQIKIVQDGFDKILDLTKDHAKEINKIKAQKTADKGAAVDPELKSRMAAQAAIEKDYFDKQQKLRALNKKEADTDGGLQLQVTKHRLEAEADLAAANVKRLEALRDAQLAKVKGNAEKEFAIRTKFEQQITNQMKIEGQKRDQAGEVVPSKVQKAARFGEDVNAILGGGGLDEGNLGGMGATIGEMVGGPMGSVIGSQIGEGLKLGLEIADALMDKYDPGRLFAAAVARVNELTEAVEGLGDSLETIGDDLDTDDIQQGFDDVRDSLEDVKKISPETGQEIENMLNMPGGKTAEELQTIKELLEQTQELAESEKLVKQYEAADNAIGASVESLGELVDKADESVNLGTGWMKLAGGILTTITGGLGAIATAGASAATVQSLSTEKLKKQQEEISYQLATQNLDFDKQNELRQESIKIEQQIGKLEAAKKVVAGEFTAAANAQLKMAEKAKGEALTQEEIDSKLVSIRQEMINKRDKELAVNNRIIASDEEIGDIIGKVSETFSDLNSAAAEHNAEIQKTIPAYEEGVKLLDEQLDAIILAGASEEEKNEIERQGLEIKIAQLEEVDAQLAAQESAIIAAIQAQEMSVDAENKRIEAAQVLADKQAEIQKIMAGEQKDASALKLVQKNDLYGALQTVQKEREKVQKGIDSLKKQVGEVGKKGGGGSGRAPKEEKEKEEKFEFDKEAIERAKEIADAAYKQEQEMLKEQQKASDAAIKAREEEAKQIAEAADRRAQLEKELAGKLKDFISAQQAQVANIRNTQFQNLGSLVSEFVSPLQQAAIESRKYGVSYEQNVKQIEEAGEKAKQDAAEIVRQREEQVAKARAEIGEIQESIEQLRETARKEVGAINRSTTSTPAQAAALDAYNQVQASLQNTLKQLSSTNVKIDISQVNLNALGDLQELINNLGNASKQAAASNKLTAAGISGFRSYQEAIDLIKQLKAGGGKTGPAASEEQQKQAAADLARANREAEASKVAQIKNIKEVEKAAIDAKNKEIDAIIRTNNLNSEAAGKQKAESEAEVNAAKENAERARRLKPLVDLNTQLRQLQEIRQKKQQILDIEKAAETETDPIRIQQILEEGTQKELELRQQILDAKLNEQDIEYSIQALKAQIAQDSELTAELAKSENEETRIALDQLDKILKKNFEQQKGLEKNAEALAIVNAASYKDQLAALDAAKERGEYEGRELIYLAERNALLKEGQAQIGAPPPPPRPGERKAPASPLAAAKTEVGKQELDTARGVTREQQRQTEAVKQTLGVASEKLKVEAQYEDTVQQIADLLATMAITEAEALKLMKQATEDKAAAQKAIVDAMFDELGITKEVAKARRDEANTVTKINKMQAAGDVTAEQGAELRAAAAKKLQKQIGEIAVKQIQETSKQIASYINATSDSIESAVAFFSQIGKKDAAGSALAGADLMTKVGTALLQAPYPLNVIGAVMVGAAEITKAMTKFVQLMITPASKQTDILKEQQEHEKRLLDLEASRLTLMQDMVELGERAVDTAREQYEFAKKEHDIRASTGTEAEVYAKASNQDLYDRQKALNDLILAHKEEASTAQQALDRGERSQEAFLRSIGQSDKGTDEEIKARVQAYIDQRERMNESTENSLELVQAEIDYRKQNIQYEKASVEEQLAALALRARIQGETIANLQAIRDIQRQVLEDALSKAGISFAGMDDQQLKDMLATTQDLPQAVIDTANAWLEANTTIEEYSKNTAEMFKKQTELIELIRAREAAGRITEQEADEQVLAVLQNELDYLNAIGAEEMAILDIEAQILEIKNKNNAATLAQNKALTDALRKYEDMLTAYRAIQNGGSLTAQQNAALAGQKANIVATLQKGGASDEEIAAFMADLPGFAEGGMIPKTGAVLATKGEYVIPQQKAKNLFKALDAFVQGNSGLYDSALAKYSNSLKNPLFSDTDLDKYMTKIFVERERAGYYTSSASKTVTIGDIYINIKGDTTNPAAVGTAVKKEMDQLANNINSLLQQNKIDKRQGVSL